MSDERSPEEIQASIEQTRDQLAEDLDKLGEKLSPAGLKEEAQGQLEGLAEAAIGAVGEAAASVTGRAEALGESLVGDLQDEPLPLMLVGAALGVGWLLVRSAQRDRRDVRPGTASPASPRTYDEANVTDRYRPDASYARHESEGRTNNGLLIGAGAVAVGAALGLLLPTNRANRTYRTGQGRVGQRGTGGSESRGNGFHFRESVEVNKGADELYRYWRKLENLPNVMSHLKSVTETGGKRSHWVAEGPAGTTAEWDATITDERPGESLAWRSAPDSQVPNEGAVGFRRVDDSTTEIVVSLTYHPPGGALGMAVANLFGPSPQQQVSDDLKTFKRRVEEGSLILHAADTPSDARSNNPST